MTRTRLLLIGLLASAASGFAVAQKTSDTGLDLTAIRARAVQQSGDAEALAATARARAEAMTQDAQNLSTASAAVRARYAADAAQRNTTTSDGPFDFDRLIASVDAEINLGAAPRFVAFVSLSMPAEALRAVLRDVPAAGGVVVFRGLPPGGAKSFTAALQGLVATGKPLDGVGIDPRLFRAFHIDAVPTYVAASTDFDLCDGFDCVSEVPPHDRITGNVTTDYVLDTFAHGGGPAARIAALHLARLRKAAP